LILFLYSYWLFLFSLFKKFDVNKDGKIQVSELKDLTVDFGVLGRVKCDINELATTLLADFDSNRDGEIDETEFAIGIEKWLKQYKFSFNGTESQGEDIAVSAAQSSHNIFYMFDQIKKLGSVNCRRMMEF